MTGTIIKVQPTILHWVKETANDHLDEKWTAKIDKWLTNESKPTIRQVKDLSKKTRIPFGYFFLNSVPKEELPLLKFRTINNLEIERPSRDLIATIHNMELKQGWLSDERKQNGYPASIFSHGFKRVPGHDDLSDNQVAASITAVLDLKLGWNVGLKNRAAFNLLRTKLNQVGVIVMYSGTVAGNTSRPISQDEFRAFALDDEYAPFIFVNSNDSYNAMLFSLVHEAVHIWFGTSELYNDNFKNQDRYLSPKTEQDINHISEAIIFPESLIKDEWGKIGDTSKVDKIVAVAKRFNASPLSAGLRALHLRLITQRTVDRLKERLDSEYQKSKAEQNGGGNFYMTKAAQTDASFAREVERSVNGRNLGYDKAFELLGVSNSTVFDKLLSKIKEKG